MSDDGPPPLAPGGRLAPGYEAIAHLSRGKALDVYDAWSAERGTRCIVKVVRPDRAGEAGPRRRLLAEGRLLRRLAHPHVVRGYEVLTEPEPLVVMETLTGATLARMLDDEGYLTVAEAAHLGLHLASALRYLHGRGILHLDLKPANVVAEAGRAKLIDLSIARRPGRGTPGVGTWCYLSPEQGRGEWLDTPADVWGLGVVLFESITGVPPFEDPDAVDDSTSSEPPPTPSDEADEPHDYRQLEVRAPRISRYRRGVPVAMADLVAACLEPEPADRPILAAVLAALEPLAGVEPADRRWGAQDGATPSASRSAPAPVPGSDRSDARTQVPPARR